MGRNEAKSDMANQGDVLFGLLDILRCVLRTEQGGRKEGRKEMKDKKFKTKSSQDLGRDRNQYNKRKGRKERIVDEERTDNLPASLPKLKKMKTNPPSPLPFFFFFLAMLKKQ